MKKKELSVTDSKTAPLPQRSLFESPEPVNMVLPGKGKLRMQMELNC